MEQPNKLLPVNDAIARCIYELYKVIRLTSTEVVKSTELGPFVQPSMGCVRTNIKDRDARLSEYRTASRCALKNFYRFLVVGFFGLHKVNLHNAP